ncbi:hypothetical protein ADICEAN_01906 [Cesiribacter andamanensis AMV16]|uniref:Uncharacterized protein n=1 Tax=Cesiribacter andamanensis AMV16 TaxID=1279009 RepID=M7N2N3_9BACT|nr:hypothetical protein ADICEAN_01906 [Cesiribacter andamanensis AMV16]
MPLQVNYRPLLLPPKIPEGYPCIGIYLLVKQLTTQSLYLFAMGPFKNVRKKIQPPFSTEIGT